MPGVIRVGTAGWSIPKDVRGAFPQAGSRLEQYAHVFPCVEINSTFYRPHRTSTYERWAASVPAGFRFSLKVPKAITHELRLQGCAEPLKAFVAQTAALEEKRAVLLVQLPPSLVFDERLAGCYFETMRGEYAGGIACEPRHASWFGASAATLLQSFCVARVAADPAPVADGARPGPYGRLAYYRWHGAPRTYYSAYADERIVGLARALECNEGESWCIFDNTALGAATPNALLLAAALRSPADSLKISWYHEGAVAQDEN
jgi:uncharacterized protein YecE (DUF72 family)